jgi:hypothetical protein
MPERVDARDVLDANAMTVKAFAATILGYFRRTGPNSWDDYEFTRDRQGDVEVNPGIRVQLERRGTDLRMRRRGTVIRVRWQPGPDDPADVRSAASAARRAYFVATYLSDYDDAPGIGAAAVIAKKLG